jgi:ADP-ribosylglycohydrolase
MPDRADRVLGCLLGAAYGDALAAPAEFLSLEQILQRWPPDGPDELTRTPSRVTDDTQMMLAVGEALVEARQNGPLSARTLEPALRRAFVAWLNDPENTRAPGMTCLRACEHLEQGLPWHEATIAASKGCGATMRAQPAGLLAGDDAASRAGIAQLQAALTHGHPTALAAADLTAWTIRDLLAGGDLAGLVVRARSYAQSQREIYRHDWLGALWQQPGVDSPEGFIARGWDECLHVIGRLELALAAPDRDRDPCLATGAGWIAEESYATGLLCCLLFPAEPRRALRRAAASSGDSDSIACLAGAFAGAHHGMAAWPPEWRERIEYRGRLEHLAARLA